MKKSEKIIFVLNIVQIIFLFINILLLRLTNDIVFIIFLIVSILSSIILLGYEKDRSRYKKDGILIAIILSLTWQIIIYLSGLFLGFVYNGYSMKFINIIKNIVPLIIIIILEEILRYQLITKSEKKLFLIILNTVLFIILDACIGIGVYDVTNINDLIEFFAIILLPSISKNILFTYLTLNFGMYCNIVYRIIITIPTYIIPILPNLNVYLNGVFNFVYPIIVFIICRKMVLKGNYENKNLNNTKMNIFKKITSYIIVIILVIIVALTSTVFKYYFLAVGSSSMSPNINKGDVVIVEKLKEDDFDKIEIGDVLIFKIDDTVVVHRVINIEKDNLEYSIETKGDNNQSKDNWVVTNENIIGVTSVKIPVIGYPTVWLNELIGGN